MTSLGTAYPVEQERCRKLLWEYMKLLDTPGVNVTFAIAMLQDLLARGEQAAMSGDLIAMIRIYEEMKEAE